MNSVAESLPDDVAALRQEALRLQQLLAQKEQFIAELLEQLRLQRHLRFGVSSEQAPGQASLFNEAEALITAADGEVNEDAAETADTDTATPKSSATRGGRRPLPPELPRVEMVHELPEHAQQCACGCRLSVIGEDISEQMDIIPLRVQVIRHIRKKYVCKGCERAPVTAALPPQPIPKSNAGAGFLAMLLTTKYVDGLPLHRFEKVLQRSGVDVPRQTLARWVIQAADVLQPLHNLLRDTLLAGDIIHCDETVVQVLKEPDKPPASQSYIWVQSGGPPGQPVVLFDYHPSRSGQVPLHLLSGYQGYLMTDGYEGYNPIAREEGITHLCCWAHARRKFIEAQRAQPKAKGAKVGKAEMALSLIGKLYGVERRTRDSSPETRYQLRQQESLPILQQLRAWLDKSLDTVLPGGKLGEALQYLHKYWPKLIRYTDRGDLPIDNNRVENAIRPFVVGRKAWLFSDTVNGAKASALIYGVVESAKANGLEPYTYLRYLLRELPAATAVEDFERLLPWRTDRHALITQIAD